MHHIRGLDFHFRRYPVTTASGGLMALLRQSSYGVTCEPSWILRSAKDTAQPDEPSGWIFESRTGPPPEGGTTVWIERFGGIRSKDSREGGQWSVYLPHER